MTLADLMAPLMFAGLIAFMLIGYPVAFSLAGLGLFFGLIVAYAGCLKGMNAARSAVGVGEATTAAVVLAILLIVEADAIFTILFNTLGW